MRVSSILSPKPSSPYLPASITGSPWLFDSKHMPVKTPNLASNALVDARAAAEDVRRLPSLFHNVYAWPDRSRNGDTIEAIAERNAARIEREAANGRLAAAKAFGPLMRDLSATFDEQHMWVTVDGTSLDPVRDADLITKEYRGPVDALKAASALPGAFAATASVVPLSSPTGITQTGSLSVRGVEALEDLARLGFAPLTDAVAGAKEAVRAKSPYASRMIGDVAVIRLSRLWVDSPKDHEAFERFVADAPRHRQATAIVVDLRGNGGGNDGYLIDWASQLRASGTQLPWPNRERYTDGRHEKIALWNTTTSYGNDPTPDDDEWFRQGQETRQYWPLNDATPLGPNEDEPYTAIGPEDYKGKVVVLVDRHSYSSAESGAMFLRDWLGATIVGERSGGAVEGSNVITYPLPSTGVGIALPSRQSHWRDTRVRESSGIPVDVALANSDAPVEKLLPQLDTWLR